jgi:hypothetical protein
MMESSYENIGVTVMTVLEVQVSVNRQTQEYSSWHFHMEYSFKGTTLEWLSPVSTVDNKFLAMLFAAAWSLPSHDRHRATLHLLLLSSMKMFLICTFEEKKN